MARHFDCVHHWGGSRLLYRDHYGFNFFDGWDVESTAWFKPNQLEFLGQVRLTETTNEDED